MTEIRVLDERTIERIAAGEVVERPASVVKELVENAIDADAERVDVTVEAGGTAGIRVADDGVGMSEDAVRAAVREHTTSKIEDVHDLEAGVGTLGFRGEALHAIGAVSRMTITTRPRGGDRGTELTVEGGEVTAVEPAGCPEGTTVAVEDLFYNVPARRKYLKQESTEFAHVNTVVTSYALANPDVAVSLTHGDRETFATPGRGDLREAVLSVYGREVARAMIEVEDADLPDGPLTGVSGLVSHPETNRAGREYCSTFVNGRYVRSAAVRDAILDAYGTQLAPDRYPFAVLFLDLPAGTVDVNVHPRKLEVRFADEDGVREQVRAAVEDALLREGLVRSSAPRGRSAPDQAEIAPGREDDAPERPEDATGSGADSAGNADGTSRGAESTGSAGAAPGVEDRSTPSSSRTGDDRGAAGDTQDAAPTARSPTDGTESGDAPPAHSGQDDDGTTPTRPTPDDRASIRGGHRQDRLGSAPGPGDDETAAFDSLPDMRILGQFRETYVVAETEDGLALIDQHAADERINYERLTTAFEGETATQALADPVEIELTAREASVFDARSDALARLGFHATRTDDRTVEVRTMPAVVAEAAGPELIRDVLGAFVTGDDAAAETVEAAADDLLADLACYPSITGNTSLTEGSIRDLLAALDDCENPYACPHGRPVVVQIDADELDDRFERDYPGHGGRRE